jgi:outer membrane protein TolC
MYLANYWQYRSFKAARLPSVSLSMTPLQYYRDFTKRYDSERNIDVYRSQQSLYSAGGLSLSQNVDATGGTFYVDSKLDYMRNFGDNTYSQYSSVPVRIGYSQSLFGFNRFKWEKKIEPLKFEKAKKQLIYEQENITGNVIGYFFNLAMAQREYDVAKSNVASSDTLYKIGAERYRIAAISQADLLTLRLDVVNAKNSLENAEMSLKRAMFDFVSYLNIDKTTQVQLDLPDKPQDIKISVDFALEQAKLNNPDYLGFRQELLEAQQEVERTSKSSIFDASLNASIGFNQAATSLSNVYRQPQQQDVVSVSLSIPILDWGVRRGRVNMAKNNLNVANISVQQKELSLAQEVEMTVNDFNIQANLIASAEEALKLATLVYDATKQQFMIGKADINSLTLSQNRHLSAQRNYISALNNYWISYYKIRKLTLYDFLKQESLSMQFDLLFNL